MNELNQVASRLSDGQFFDNLSPTLQMALFLGSLVMLPAALASLTCFTRIVIVLSFVRRGMAAQEIPPNSVLIGLALFLTLFVMGPTWNAISETAILPYLDNQLSGEQAFQRGIRIQQQFMLRQTRKHDLALFIHMSGETPPQTPEDTSIRVLVPAFVISELKTAFLMGFAIFIPFLLVDVVVSTVLMSMGMFMMPPVIVSTPFKVLLFVLADGWHLVALSLGESFG
jgi:flagellar biosynthetic protein FliP